MLFNKDLRDINEEEFKEVYEYLRERTDGFTSIDERFLKENPRLLYPVRIILGFSQLEFSKLMGTTDKQWVRHFETGRQGFVYSKMFPICLDVINHQLSLGKILNYKPALALLKRSQFAKKKWEFEYPDPKYNFKRLSDMDEKDFIKYFKLASKETKNFTKFNEEFIIADPGFITVLRVILGLNIRQLCKRIDMQTRRIRKYESFTERMMPETSERIINFFRESFKEKEVSLEIALKYFRRFSPFDKLELNIRRLLENSKIKTYHNNERVINSEVYAKMHTNLKSIRKDINVDFVIKKKDNPLCVIEATKICKKRLRAHITFRVAYIDHRFQLLKLKHKSLKTLMIIKCEEEQKELVKRVIKRETVNTDFWFVNNFGDLSLKIKEIIKH